MNANQSKKIESIKSIKKNQINLKKSNQSKKIKSIPKNQIKSI